MPLRATPRGRPTGGCGRAGAHPGRRARHRAPLEPRSSRGARPPRGRRRGRRHRFGLAEPRARSGLHLVKTSSGLPLQSDHSLLGKAQRRHRRRTRRARAGRYRYRRRHPAAPPRRPRALLRSPVRAPCGRDRRSRAAQRSRAPRAHPDPVPPRDVPELEVKQAGLGVGRAEASLKALSSDVGVARGELNLDLGRERDAPVALAGHLEARPALPDFGKLVERALSEGREARELRQRVAVEESRLRLARTGWIPDLTAGAGAEFNDPEFSVGPQFRLGLSIPILYRKSAEQAQARAALEVLSREREALRQRLGTSLSSAFARVQAADDQVGLYVASLVPSAKEVRELYRDSYREGTVGILNLVDALRSEREVQLGYARALLDFHRALADLEQQAGVELTDGPA